MAEESQDIPQEEEAFWEDPTRASEYISAAYYAIAALSEVDLAMLPKVYTDMRDRGLKRALKIIDGALSDLYDEMFVVNEKEDTNE